MSLRTQTYEEEHSVLGQYTLAYTTTVKIPEPQVLVQAIVLLEPSWHVIPELKETYSSGNTKDNLPTEGSLVAHVKVKVYYAPVYPTVKTVVLLTAEVTVHVLATVV